MNQTVEKITTNGNAQNESAGPPTTKEGFEAPSPEVKAPFVPAKKRTERDKWKAILVGVALLAVIAVAALTHKSGLKALFLLGSKQQTAFHRGSTSEKLTVWKRNTSQ